MIGLTFWILLSLWGACFPQLTPQKQMMFADDSRGRSFSKDPHVLWFGGSWYLSKVEVRWRKGQPYLPTP